jgi:UDP-N-acetylmuramate--alanine ligase
VTDFAIPPGSVIHLVGIGGSGMSSLAFLLSGLGFRVTGSDLSGGSVIDALRAVGIKVTMGHRAESVGIASLVVRSSAIPDSNLEVVRARELGVAVLKHADMIGLISQTHHTLAVSGTHGKTTTTAMLTTILIAAGFDPIALIGGVVPSLGSGAHLGSGGYFVVEADEFDRRFHALHPEIAIVTNVEADHLDYYGSVNAVREAFAIFVGRVTADGWIILNADSPAALALVDVRPEQSVTYGLTDQASWRATGIATNDDGGSDFVVFAHDVLVGRFRLKVPGIHNVSNALAAAVAAGRIGIDFTTAAAALEEFTGVQRRLERIGEVDGIVVVDDYAHHPTKVRASLAGAREHHSGRIICLFQPHLYHRLSSLFRDFTRAFEDADLVIMTDVYSPAGRGPSAGDRTAEELARAASNTEAVYGGELSAATDLVVANARRGDLIITMGAGDVTTASRVILERLSVRRSLR